MIYYQVITGQSIWSRSSFHDTTLSDRAIIVKGEFI